MIVGFTASATGLLWVSRLSVDSGYLSVLGPLVVVGLGNGLAFVPLTALSLSGVEPQDAGAASGLVNVTQQVGGALGLAVLVTVFGPASRSALHSATSTGAAEAAREAFVYGADRAFLVAAAFLVATLVLVTVAVRPARRDRAVADELELDLELATAEAEGLAAAG